MSNASHVQFGVLSRRSKGKRMLLVYQGLNGTCVLNMYAFVARFLGFNTDSL